VANDIRVAVPAQARFLRIARLTAAGVATDLDFDLRDIEDLRVAVDEMCAVLIDGASPDVELELRYRTDGDELEIVGTCDQPGEPPEIHPVALELLSMTSDAFEIDGDGTTRSFRLLKRRRDPSV
jgi:serine/threonine-protein kinase RsbW